jgi:hypothetical protein
VVPSAAVVAVAKVNDVVSLTPLVSDSATIPAAAVVVPPSVLDVTPFAGAGTSATAAAAAVKIADVVVAAA